MGKSRIAERDGVDNLVEREAILGMFDVALGQADRGEGQLVVVDGPAGAGKSTLAEAALGMARARGMTALGATGAEFEMDFGWGVLLQLFEREVRNSEANERAELFRGPAVHAFDLLIEGQGYDVSAPERHGSNNGDADGDSVLALDREASRSEYGDGRSRDVTAASIRHGLYWFVANLSDRRPLLLVIDDLQWVDPPSVGFVAYLARRVQDLPVVLLVVSRSGVVNATSRVRDKICGDSRAHRVVPQPLTCSGVATLVRAKRATAGDSLCNAVFDATGGNAFLVAAVGSMIDGASSEPDRTLADRLSGFTPDSLRLAVAERLGDLDPAVATLARAIAVSAAPAAWRAAEQLSGLSPMDAERALAMLRDDAWVRAHKGNALNALDANGTADGDDEFTVSFHPLIRSAIVATIPMGELQDLHARAMQVGAQLGFSPDQIAVHAVASRRAGSGDTTAVLMNAAERARRSGAGDVALTLLRRAAQEPPPPQERAHVLSMLARTAGMMSAPDVGQLFDDAIRAATDDRTIARLRLAAGRSLVACRSFAEAVAVLDQALAADDGSDPTYTDKLRMTHHAALRTDPNRRSQWRPEHDDIEVEALHNTSVMGCTLMAEAAYSRGVMGTDFDQARRLAVASVEGDLGVEFAFANPNGWAFAMHALQHVNEYEVARSVAQRVAAKAEAAGSVHTFKMAMTYVAQMTLCLGLLPDALAVHGVLDPSSPGVVPYFVPLNAVNLSLTYLALDRIDEAAEALSILTDSYKDDLLGGGIPEAWAWIKLSRGDAAGAVDEVRKIDLDGGGLSSFNPSTTTCRTSLARALAASGNVAEALVVSDTELALARAWGAPRALGLALTTAGMIRAGQAGVEYLDEAVQVLSKSQDKLRYGWALVERASRLLDLRKPTAARPDLDTALQLAIDPDYRGGALERRAVAELARAGVRPPKRALTGFAALTPTELRVARAATGTKTNSEIAADMFVSRKAIEFHLSNAYRKLGIRSRRELAGVLDAI